MYLIIDFGITKLANKAKKKNWEKDLGGRALVNRGSTYRGDNLTSGRFLSSVWVRRGANREAIRSNTGLSKLTRKPRSGERVPRPVFEKEMVPDTKNFTDIRKVEDKALSKSGYMGYKNTPNSYFEESVPMVESGKKTKIKPRVYV